MCSERIPCKTLTFNCEIYFCFSCLFLFKHRQALRFRNRQHFFIFRVTKISCFWWVEFSFFVSWYRVSLQYWVEVMSKKYLMFFTTAVGFCWIDQVGVFKFSESWYFHSAKTYPLGFGSRYTGLCAQTRSPKKLFSSLCYN